MRRPKSRIPTFNEAIAGINAREDGEHFSPFLRSIDWPLLHLQKQSLFDHMSTLQGRSSDVTYRHLEGILRLIDQLQDAAAQAGLWQWPDEPDALDQEEARALEDASDKLSKATSRSEILDILRAYARRPYATNKRSE